MFCCLILLCFVRAISSQSVEENDFSLHKRDKRFVVFPRGGGFKIVFGFAMPIKLGSKQSMAFGWNMQFQYVLPQNVTQLEVYPPILRRKRETFSNDRKLAYAGIEAILNSEGLNGRECLLRSICENAFSSTHHETNGLYGHLLHIALTPDYGTEGHTQSELDPVYMEARKAGQFGADCHSLYSNCNFGDGLLDHISVLDT